MTHLIKSSIHYVNRFVCQGCGEARTYPSCLRATGVVHSGQIMYVKTALYDKYDRIIMFAYPLYYQKASTNRRGHYKV